MGFAEAGKGAASRQLISGEQTTSGRDAQLIAHPPHCWEIFFSFFAIPQFAFGDFHISTAGLKKIFTNLDH